MIKCSCIFLLMYLLMLGCVNTTQPKNDIIAAADSSSYSQEFIDSLRALYKGKITLAGDRIIADGDTVSFPGSINAGVEYKLAGQNKDTVYRLRLNRINQTSVKYRLSILKGNKTIFEDDGTAHLYALFFLGAETIEDSSGNSYMADDYYTRSGDCTIVLKIAEAEGTLLATMSEAECKGTREANMLSNIPLLR